LPTQVDPPSAPPLPATALDMGGLLAALRRRWLLATSLGVVLAAASAATAWFVQPPKYTVQTTLHIASQNPSIVYKLDDSSQFANYQRTQQVLVKSRLVLNAALNKPEVRNLRIIRKQAEPIPWMEKNLTADFNMAPEILRISMTGDDPEDLAVIVNEVRKAYLTEIVDRERIERNEHYDQLQRLYTSYDDQLKTRRDTLRKLTETVGGRGDVAEGNRQKFALDRLAAAQQELLRVKSELVRAQIEAKRGTGIELSDPSDADIEAAMGLDADVRKYTAEIAQLELDVKQIRRIVTRGEDDPDLKRTQRKLDATRKALDERRTELRSRIVAELREKKRRDLQGGAVLAHDRIAFMKDFEKALDDEIKRIEKDAHLVNKDTSDMRFLEEEINQINIRAQKIGDRMEALRVELQAPSRVKLLEEASVAGSLDNNRRVKTAGTAGFAFFALGLLGVSFWEFRARRIGSVDEVRTGLGIALVGTLPPPEEPRRGFWKSGAEVPAPGAKSFLAESVDSMRTMLLHVARTESLKSVMVTSALSGEGKTSLACHLATSLSRAGCRTLLVDADLRRPAAHRVFGLPLDRGLSDLLRGEAAAEELIRPTVLPNLWILSAGRQDRQALEALDQRLEAIFRDLRDAYDFVVVDSSPILPVADALVVGQHVDAVIFSILRDVSRLPALHAAHERIVRLRIRVLGAVVNGVRQDTYVASY
jgi:capsular exopolysaccharide synthesis family protein